VGFLGCTAPEVSCGNKAAGVQPVPMSLGIAAAMSVADDYSLSVRLQNQGVRFLEPCRLGIGGLDASQLAKNLIDEKVNAKLAELSELVGREVSVRAAAEKFWPSLQQPIDAGSGAQLQLHPTGIAQSIAAETPRRLTVELDVTMRPVLTLGAPRAAAPAAAEPLPPLSSDAPGERALYLNAEQWTKVASLEERVARALKSARAVARGSAVSVTAARLAPARGTLALEVETKDHGTFHYDAVPTIAADGARTGLKLARPSRGTCDRDCADLMLAFESALSWPAADLATSAKRTVDAALAKPLAPGLQLKADLRDKPTACTARVDGDYVVFVLPFRGSASVDWEVEVP